MAGAGMNDIKSRIKSVNGTMQITKAMELVATSKLRRAKAMAERSRPFRRVLDEAISSILSSNTTESISWVSPSKASRTLFVVIAGDRGLAGGYNANVFRLTESLSFEGERVYLPIGKKAVEFCRHRNKEILTTAYEEVSDISVGDTFELARLISEGYLGGQYDRVELIYTEFVSMLTQSPKSKTLLPLTCESSQESCDPITEGNVEELLDRIVPQYIGGVLYAAVCEALASESGSRRTAMNAANKNAEEMIDSLMLKYNRARQAIITQEITEIVSGAEAL